VSKRDHGGHGGDHHDGDHHSDGHHSDGHHSDGQDDQGHHEDSDHESRHDSAHGGAVGSRDYARLEDADLTLRMSKDEEAKRLGRAQRRLLHLRLINGGQLNEGTLGPPVCIVFEGWDAAGKGGAIKRLVEPLDPRHVHIAPFAAPTPDELRHHFLWRFWPPLPGWGGMTIFDRSWYGRVLVERVESLATEVQWRRAYQEINDFEHTLAEEGMIVIKLWMHMSHEEQLRRFVRRRDDPLKSWKLTDEDWRNREKRGEYEAAVSDMLRLTCGPLAHWDVISAENKRYGRVQVIETVIRRMEQGMRRWGVLVPSHEAEVEETELALVIDDAEYQPDPVAAAAAAAASAGADGAQNGSGVAAKDVGSAGSSSGGGGGDNDDDGGGGGEDASAQQRMEA
jgi:AMP-polyphosphate phosphotransferase